MPTVARSVPVSLRYFWHCFWNILPEGLLPFGILRLAVGSSLHVEKNISLIAAFFCFVPFGTLEDANSRTIRAGLLEILLALLLEHSPRRTTSFWSSTLQNFFHRFSSAMSMQERRSERFHARVYLFHVCWRRVGTCKHLIYTTCLLLSIGAFFHRSFASPLPLCFAGVPVAVRWFLASKFRFRTC